MRYDVNILLRSKTDEYPWKQRNKEPKRKADELEKQSSHLRWKLIDCLLCGWNVRYVPHKYGEQIRGQLFNRNVA